MEIVLYQINSERDYEECEFMDYDYTQEHGGIDPYAYDRVWAGTINADTLEDVYAILNGEIRPDNYMGRSMSCSDVCQVIGDDGQSQFYFVDRIGFKSIEFDESLTREAKEREITVLALHPGKTAEIITIANTLEAMQKFVGGFIEAAYPSEDPIAIVMDEEGKLKGKALCRGLYTDDGTMYDIAAGDCFICGLGDSDFASLRGELLEKYMDKFKHPERFVKFGDQILAIKMPEEQKEENTQQEEKAQKHHRKR